MTRIAGIILNGGKASRLGGVDKGSLVVGHRSCFDHAVNVLRGHVDEIAVSAARVSTKPYAKDYAHIADWPCGAVRPGAAFAILGTLAWAHRQGFEAIVTLPVDTPFLPNTYVPDLKRSSSGVAPAVYQTHEGLQGLHALWPVSKIENLKSAILENYSYKISDLHKSLASKIIDVSKADAKNFLNINTPEALKIAKNLTVK